MKNQIEPAYLSHYLEIAEEINLAGIRIDDIALATMEFGHTTHTDMNDIEDTSVFDPRGTVVKVRSVVLVELTLKNGSVCQFLIDRQIHYVADLKTIVEGSVSEE